MATREELYRYFGPKLVEALTLLLFDEINILRAAASLPARTTQQLTDALQVKLDTITDCDWMSED